MHSITDLSVLINALNLKVEHPHEDFLVFKFSEINNVEELPTGFHHKDFFDISVTKVDNGTLMVGENIYNKLDNSVCFLSPNQSMKYIPSSSHKHNEDDDGIAILFRASFLKNYEYSYQLQNEFSFFKLHTRPHYQLTEHQMSIMYRIFEEIHTEFQKQDHCSLELIKAYILIILNLCKRELANEQHFAKVSRAEEITCLFEEKAWSLCSQYKSIANYASLLNISPAYLSECVKKATGKTAKDIISDYQIMKAKTYLLQSEIAINQIATALGFEETTNFTKFFKKKTGKTPKEFRMKP
ncbi:helix-turn-helix domain-containing protein [Puteibacter caeruleilacunae]|nr:helix-turn-helix domain-containing protein [Puteibacter caeruleilacunae]